MGVHFSTFFENFLEISVVSALLTASKDNEIEIDDYFHNPGYILDAGGIQVVEMDDVEKGIEDQLPLKIESVTSQLFIDN